MSAFKRLKFIPGLVCLVTEAGRLIIIDLLYEPFLHSNTQWFELEFIEISTQTVIGQRTSHVILTQVEVLRIADLVDVVENVVEREVHCHEHTIERSERHPDENAKYEDDHLFYTHF